MDVEDPLEKEMTTHSSILAWRIPWTVKSGVAESDTTEATEHARIMTHGEKAKVSISIRATDNIKCA